MKSTLLQKSLLALTIVAMTASCSKNSSAASTTPADSGNSGQTAPTNPVRGINPALKAYGVAVTEVTGLLGLGGRLLDVVADPLSQSININLYLPETFLFLAQTYLLKYPQVKSTVLTDAAGKKSLNMQISIADAAAAYKKWNDKKKAEVVQQPTNPSNPSAPVYNGGCNGTYAGTIDPPAHEVRIASRNQSLRDRGIEVTGNDEIDNANAGGGPPDGGIWLAGTFQWETDANCNVTSGEVLIFGAYPFAVTGTVNADGTFNLHYWGRIPGKINADKTVTGKVEHAGGEEHVHGVLNGVFTPR